jgi:hypothetical protein
MRKLLLVVAILVSDCAAQKGFTKVEAVDGDPLKANGVYVCVYSDQGRFLCMTIQEFVQYESERERGVLKGPGVLQWK